MSKEEEKLSLLGIGGNYSYGSIQSSEVHVHADMNGQLKVRHNDHEDFVVRVGDHLELQHPSCEKGCCMDTHGEIVEEVDSVTGSVRWRIIDYTLASRSPTVARIVNHFSSCSKSPRHVASKEKNSTTIEIKDGSEEKCVISVNGICCASEVAVVQGLLEPIPGVKKVNTNAILRETKVTFDSNLVSSKDLADKLNEASLGAHVKKTTEKLYDSIDGDNEIKVQKAKDDNVDETTQSSNLPKWNVLLAFVLWTLSMIHYAASYLTHELQLSRFGSRLPSNLKMYVMLARCNLAPFIHIEYNPEIQHRT